MSEEVHPVVELLLARMKSHPEEFQMGTNRWGWALVIVQDNGSENDVSAINEGLSSIRLTEAHEWMLDELMNGDERRRNMAVENEQIKRGTITVQQGTITMQQVPSALEACYSNLQNSAPALHGAGFLSTLKKGLGL